MSSRRAFFRNQLPTSVDEDQNAAVAALIVRMNSVEGRAGTLEGDVALKAAAIADLSGALVAEAAARAAAVAAEADARAAAIALKAAAIADLSGALLAEADARAAAIATVGDVVAQQAADTAAALNLKASLAELGAETTARQAAIAAESSARISGLALKSDKTYVDATFHTKAEAASRVGAENAFLTAFKDAIFLEGESNTDVEFNYTTLIGGVSGGDGGGSGGGGSDGGVVTTNYLRFTPLKRRNGDDANEYALAEFELYNGSTQLDLTGATITSAGYSGDPLSFVVDGNINSKIFPFTNPLVFAFASSIISDGYKFVYMNAQVDHPAYGRTPIRWTVEASVDGSVWTIVSDKSSEDVFLGPPAEEWGEFPVSSQLFNYD